ncbi:hypothetical protein EBU58_11950, partial [bacterium]|nr:hypothetical protein [bacterium]
MYGAASSFSIEIDHRKNHLELVGQAPPSARLARALASITGMEIGGKIGGKIAYSGDPNIQDASLSMTLNLAGTSVVIPQINWTKKPEEDGRATLS